MHGMKDWDDLRFVLAAGRAGGIAGAARALGVNHATVSRRLAGFEARVGARLFDRLPDGLAPTEAGREAIAAAEAMDAAARDLSTGLTDRDRQLTGRLVVTAPPMIVMGPFATLIAAFHARYPDVDLRIVASNDLLDLRRREADVALRAIDAPDDDLFGVKLTESRAAVYGAPAYFERVAEELARPPAEARLHWIGFNDQETPPEEFRARYPATRMAPRFNDKLAMLAAAKAGMGLVRLPCFHGDLDRDLVRLPGGPINRYPDKWILTHPSLRDTARVRLFIRHIADAVREMRPLFLGERAREHAL